MAGSDPLVNVPQNPYVGPRPFERGETLRAREREITELSYLLSAERIVLLHSPSGAGKSSLINAGLLPRLRARFDVWQPTRINAAPPTELAASVNRYVLSAALGFEQGIPEQMRRTPQQIAGMTLREYARTLPRPPNAMQNTLLVFDQFEEILTTDPLAVEARRDFFASVGDLLRDSSYWALFSMREDYLAPLDPFVDEVPTHLRNRFRIDLLSCEQATEAIAAPAADAGRAFDGDAVQKLVLDLARVKVQQPDGTFVEQAGINVEPLQLQVVCRQLWERLPADCHKICLADVENFGNVTEALATYYSMAVERIGAGSAVLERQIREWVGDRLITPEGIRSQVLRGAVSSEGLLNATIEMLVNTHLLRAEPRAGVVWYELAHDRLIDPIRTNNALWRDQHLHKVQKLAAVWDKEDRPTGMLLADADLASAKDWARLQTSLTAEEQDFLAASSDAQSTRLKARRQAARNRWLTMVSTAGFLLAVVLALLAGRMWNKVRQSRDQIERQGRMTAELARHANWTSWLAEGHRIRAESSALEAQAERLEANQQKSLAQQQAEIALAGQLMAEARVQSEQTPHLLPFATLLALESTKRRPATETDEFLRHSLSLLRSPSGAPVSLPGAVRALAFSPGTDFVATASADGSVHVAETTTGRLRFQLPHDAQVQSVVWSPDGRLLATLSTSGSAMLWDASSGQRLGQPLHTTTRGGFLHLAFSPDNRYVAAANTNSVSVWQVGAAAASIFQTPGVAGDAISGPLFTRDGRYLITARAGTLTLWSAGTWQPAFTASYDTNTRTRGSRRDLILSPDGRYLAVADKIFLLDNGISMAGEIAALVVPESSFSPDNQTLATFAGGTATLWTGAKWSQSLDVPLDGGVTALTFSSQPGYLATASQDGTARIFRLGSSSREQPSRTLQREPAPEVREIGRMSHEGEVAAVAFSPGGKDLVTSTTDFTIERWQVDAIDESILSYTPGETYTLSPAISTDGLVIARGNPNRIVVSRAADGPDAREVKVFTPPAGRTFGNFDLGADGHFLTTALLQRAATAPAAAPSRAATEEPAWQEASVSVWDIGTGKVASNWSSSVSSDQFLFAPGNRLLAVAHAEEQDVHVDVHDLHTGRSVFSTRASSLPDSFLFSPTGRFLAAIAADGSLHVWDTGSWTERSMIPAEERAIDLTFSGTADVLAATIQPRAEAARNAPQLRTVRVWRAPDWHLTHEVSRSAATRVELNTAIALSPDGDTLATADWARSVFLHKRSISLWQPGQERLKGEVPLSAKVTGLLFSSNSRYLALTTADRLSIWDTLLDQQTATVETPASTSITVFSPDDRYMVTLDQFQGAMVWFWSSERVSSVLCKHLTLNLSREEWDHYLHGEPYRKTCPNLPEGKGSSEGILSPPLLTPAAISPTAAHAAGAKGINSAQRASAEAQRASDEARSLR